jgi:hypothetical protein
MSVIEVVMISSPGSGSTTATAACTAAEPDAQATACSTPISSATAFSKRLTIVPLVLVSVPDRRASATSWSSASSKLRPLASWSFGSVMVAAGGATVTGSSPLSASRPDTGQLRRTTRLAIAAKWPG